MSKRSTKQTQANNIFQRIEDNYMVPTYMVSNYLGETGSIQKDGPTKADLKKLIERYRANTAACEETPKQVCTRVADWLPIKKYL